VACCQLKRHAVGYQLSKLTGPALRILTEPVFAELFRVTIRHFA
jgi:hypothetical protein